MAPTGEKNLWMIGRVVEQKNSKIPFLLLCFGFDDLELLLCLLNVMFLRLF